MSDASLIWGGDLVLSPVGDVATVSGTQLGEQRLLRRLLTNPGDYLWYADYGAGLGQFVGLPCDADAVRARIRSQIFLESFVARTPEPTIDVTSVADGSIYVHIRYVDSADGSPQTLSFVVG